MGFWETLASSEKWETRRNKTEKHLTLETVKYKEFKVGQRRRAANNDKRSVTLCVLRLDKGFNEFICGLCVEGQGVVEGQEVGTLLQERLLQAHTTSVEVLLTYKRAHDSC